MGQLTFTTADIEKVLDGRYNSFRQAISDSQYTLAMSSNFAPANCLSIDDFTTVYREYNESLSEGTIE